MAGAVAEDAGRETARLMGAASGAMTYGLAACRKMPVSDFCMT